MPWAEPGQPAPLPPLLAEYSAFRYAHSNPAAISITREITVIQVWLRFLQNRQCPLPAIRLTDVDSYLFKLRRRYAVATVATHLSCLRLFLRFLQYRQATV